MNTLKVETLLFISASSIDTMSTRGSINELLKQMKGRQQSIKVLLKLLLYLVKGSVTYKHKILLFPSCVTLEKYEIKSCN